MASVAVGSKDGVAKNSNLVVVKADVQSTGPKIPSADAIAPERWIDALAETYDHIDRNSLKGKSVVSMSVGAEKRQDSRYNDCIKDAFTALLKAITSDDIPAVAAAGQNYGPIPPDLPPGEEFKIKTYPALLGGANGISELVVVSAVGINGRYEFDARYSDFTIAALGEGTDCVNSGGKNEYHGETGSSPGKFKFRKPCV